MAFYIILHRMRVSTDNITNYNGSCENYWHYLYIVFYYRNLYDDAIGIYP